MASSTLDALRQVRSFDVHRRKNPVAHPATKMVSPLNEISGAMNRLRESIQQICDQSSIGGNETFTSVASNSTVSKLHRLFLSIADQKASLLSEHRFYDLIGQGMERSMTRTHPARDKPMDFVEFLEHIDLVAKGNCINREYLFKKVRSNTGPLRLSSFSSC